MERKDLIKARLAWVRLQLDEILDRLTPDLANWAPAEGMRTVSGQLFEIMCVEIPLVPRLQEGRVTNDDDEVRIAGVNPDLDMLRDALIRVRQTTLDYLDSLSESELAEAVPHHGRWFGSFWLPEMPRAEFFLNIAEHELYHVGQLISYLWYRGDDPYKW